MLALPDDRKRFLISQNEAARTSTPSKSRSAASGQLGDKPTSPTLSSSSDTIGRSSVIPTGWSHRFSISSITNWASTEAHGSGTGSAKEEDGG